MDQLSKFQASMIWNAIFSKKTMPQIQNTMDRQDPFRFLFVFCGFTMSSMVFLVPTVGTSQTVAAWMDAPYSKAMCSGKMDPELKSLGSPNADSKWKVAIYDRNIMKYYEILWNYM